MSLLPHSISRYVIFQQSLTVVLQTGPTSLALVSRRDGTRGHKAVLRRAPVAPFVFFNKLTLLQLSHCRGVNVKLTPSLLLSLQLRVAHSFSLSSSVDWERNRGEKAHILLSVDGGVGLFEVIRTSTGSRLYYTGPRTAYTNHLEGQICDMTHNRT